jgi:LCP family protein required for cell wall assembly
MTDQRRGGHPYRGGEAGRAAWSVMGEEGDDLASGDPSTRSGAGDMSSPDYTSGPGSTSSPGDMSGGEGDGPPGPGGEEDTAPAGAGGGRHQGGARVPPRPRRRRRALMWGALSTVLVLVGSGSLIYLKLNSNLQSAPLDLGGAQAVEKADPFGQAPVNILLIGSDSRSNGADCKLGGDCGGGANADVEMVVHLSADRSNATVMSIPRDTIVNVPQCTDTSHHVYPGLQGVQITSSLQDGGPGCTVATVHALTGITIDHFVMIDFSGVVNMSDDVGGVPVCVSANVSDPYSHLRLTKGTHLISGLQALYRTQAQHMYLGALIRKMKSASTLANPVTLYRLANDATKAVTVDPGLDSIPKLIGLASDLNKVPARRITFVTMPTVPYPGNPTAWLAPAMPTARQLFNDMINDMPLTSSGSAVRPTATPTVSPTGSPAPSVDKAAVRVSVENGSGLAGRARNIAAALAADGFTRSTADANAPYTTTTSLTYGPGARAQARTVAKALGLPTYMLHRSGASLTLVIGTDWSSGTRYPGSSPTASPSPSPSVSGPPDLGATAAPPGSSPENASRASECAQVNPIYSF